LFAEYAPLFSRTKARPLRPGFCLFWICSNYRATRNFDSDVAIVDGREGFGATGAA